MLGPPRLYHLRTPDYSQARLNFGESKQWENLTFKELVMNNVVISDSVPQKRTFNGGGGEAVRVNQFYLNRFAHKNSAYGRHQIS